MNASPNIRMSVKNMQSRMSLNNIVDRVSPTRIIQNESLLNGSTLVGVSEAKILVENQNKEVEIERLYTTNFTLKNKVLIKDDIKRNIEMMKKRIEEQNYLNSLVEVQN